jgi:hypothetical protein
VPFAGGERQNDNFNFEINADSGDKSWRERILDIFEQQTSFAHSCVTQHEKLHVEIKRFFRAFHFLLQGRVAMSERGGGKIEG